MNELNLNLNEEDLTKEGNHQGLHLVRDLILEGDQMWGLTNLELDHERC